MDQELSNKEAVEALIKDVREGTDSLEKDLQRAVERGDLGRSETLLLMAGAAAAMALCIVKGAQAAGFGPGIFGKAFAKVLNDSGEVGVVQFKEESGIMAPQSDSIN